METETAARPEGKAAHGEEGATGPSLVERIKGTLGLGGGQKPGRERAEGEKASEPSVAGEVEAAEEPAETPRQTRPTAAGTEPLHAPATPAATAQLPPRSAAPALSTATSPTTGSAAQPAAEGVSAVSAAPGASAAGPVVSPAEGAKARLEQTGARKGRISEGEADAGAAAKPAAHPGPEVGAPQEAKQGDRVKVGRLPLGPIAPGTAAGGMQQVEVRPGHEAAGPMSSTEVAGMKAREHGLRAQEGERVVHTKQRQLHELRSQAELLEVQAQGLLAEASREKMKRDQMMAKRGQFEQREWSKYAEAERAEKERRKVVDEARPAALAAEEAELDSVHLRQMAADTQYHAEVLERRAQALVQESQEMAALAMQRQLNSEQIAAQLLVKQQEQQEWQQRVDEVTEGALPRYIEECEVEIGRHMARIAELRDEIQWARLEMDRMRGELSTWERVLGTKRSEAGLLRLRMQQAREEADAARLRSYQAAEEAREPTDLALVKYEEAYRLAQVAEEREERARVAQEEVLRVVQQAVGPEQARQERLREAAEAEARAKQLELQEQMVEGKIERRLAEAETRAETAMELAQQAERVQEEHRAARLTAEAQREMEGMYSESEQRHAGIAAELDRVGRQPPSAEARELMRRQKERYATPEWTEAPTVPVEQAAVPAPPTPLSPTQVQAMLADAPRPPVHQAAAAPARVEQSEEARVPVAA